MKQYHWLIALVFIIGLGACGTVYNEHQDVTGTLTWKAGEKHTFKALIEDNAPNYNVYINLRHTTALKLKSFDLAISITNPDGTSETKDYPLSIRSSNNELLGGCSGDFCDTETLILQNHKFPATGEYTFSMVAKAEKDIPNMMEIGLVIKKKE